MMGFFRVYEKNERKILSLFTFDLFFRKLLTRGQ